MEGSWINAAAHPLAEGERAHGTVEEFRDLQDVGQLCHGLSVGVIQVDQQTAAISACDST